jgi:tRNA(His) 5'-end guanylyltransferase
MFNDELGDRMKFYETFPIAQQIKPPFLIRLDGRSFSTWTRGLTKPFDKTLISVFHECTEALLEETNADFAYHQSDEITLGFLKPVDPNTQMYFNGKTQKLVSVTSSFLTAQFNMLIEEEFPNKPLAYFDSKVFEVPNETEAVNALIWRQQDAKRNSIQLLGRSHFSHKQMYKKSSMEIVRMLKEVGINWEEEPNYFKYGQLFKRVKTQTSFTTEEISKLPPKHEARSNPSLTIERGVVQKYDNSFYKDVDNFFELVTRRYE